MKRNLFLTLVLLIQFLGEAISQNNSKDLALTNANVIEFGKDSPLEAQTILIVNGTIVDIFPTGSKNLSNDVRQINLDGKFILPGLIDGHTHLSANQNREVDLQAMLKSGITSVRDVGGNAMVYINLKEKARSGALHIPDIYFAATFFGPQFMIDPRVKFAAGPHEPGTSPWMRLIDDETNLEHIIDEAISEGVSGIKLYSSLKPEQLEAITEVAQAKGLQVWGHGTIFPSKPSDFVKAKPNGISHALSLVFEVYDDIPDEFNDAVRNWLPQKDISQVDENNERFQELFKNMKMKNIIFEPTISAWKNPENRQIKEEAPKLPNLAAASQMVDRKAILDWNERITKKAIEEGVKIAAGTDQFTQMKWIQDEIIFLNELGLSPLEAIKSATLTNAEVLGLASQFGSIEVGKKADLLVLDKNPLTDIQNIWSVYLVIKEGAQITD